MTRDDVGAVDAPSPNRPETGESENRDRSGTDAAVRVDSPVVVTTVRVLSPFVLTFALFTLFHGTSSVGGGFQGGVVAAAAVVTLAFAFGIREVSRWLNGRALLALVAAGPVVFGSVAVAGVLTGGAFLGFETLPIPKPSVYATEAIELGIGATVCAVIIALFVGLGLDPRAGTTAGSETTADGYGHSHAAVGTDSDDTGGGRR